MLEVKRREGRKRGRVCCVGVVVLPEEGESEVGGRGGGGGDDTPARCLRSV